MFERITCYIRSKKMDKNAKAIKRLGENINNNSFIEDSNEILAKNRILRKMMWRDREIAKRFNLEAAEKGFF